MKGQTALEYMIITGITLGIIIPLFLFINSYAYSTNLDLKIRGLESSLEELAQNSKLVYSQGYPAKITSRIEIPNGVLYSNVTQDMFVVGVMTPSGKVDIIAISEAPLNGSLPQTPGTHKVYLQMTSEGYVNVTY
ncbi:MAG: hypothetical protein DRP11_02030 [Candidatus Aenigmatarchaeota archaeon]|nr:MAG: hypothetical protein DRP11_02030 [Candidatus Aenigmarchaeota archaeon]